MSVLRLNVRRLCVPIIMSLGVCFIKKIALVKAGAFAWCNIKIQVISGVRFERQKADKKNKPTWKLKHADSILEYFEYFFQISSKSISIILSYTVSKSARFFLRHSVHTHTTYHFNGHFPADQFWFSVPTGHLGSGGGSSNCRDTYLLADLVV